MLNQPPNNSSANADGFPVTSAVDDAAFVPVVASIAGSTGATVAEEVNRRLAVTCELVSQIHICGEADRACQQLADSLESFLEAADHVYVALHRQPKGLRVQAASKGQSLKARLKTDLLSAMREAVAKNETVYFGRQADAGERPGHERFGIACHDQLAEELDCPFLTTVPLNSSSGELQGVLVLAGSQGEMPSQDRGLLQSLATPVADALALMMRVERHWVFRKIKDLQDTITRANANWMLLLCFVVCFVAALPFPYNVHCRCKVDPAQKRFVSAPFAGQLEETFVEPGDIVQANQALTRLDATPTELELAEVEAEYKQAESKRDGYLAAYEQGNARLAQLEMERLRARHDLLMHRLEHLSVTSPIGGIVLTGDLKRSSGKPVDTGDVLFEVSPLNQLDIEVSIPEDDVRFVKTDDLVKVRLDAFPFRRFTGKVHRIYPAAVLEQDENVFLARVKLPVVPQELRPGMAGTANIITAAAPLGWIWMHKPLAHVARWCGW